MQRLAASVGSFMAALVCVNAIPDIRGKLGLILVIVLGIAFTASGLLIAAPEARIWLSSGVIVLWYPTVARWIDGGDPSFAIEFFSALLVAVVTGLMLRLMVSACHRRRSPPV